MKKILLVVLVSLGLQTQAQSNLCDSLSYTVIQGLPLTVYGEASGIINMVDSIEWLFSACNSVACYTPQGNNPYSFPQINVTDTVKFCYDAYVYTPNQMVVCSHCDSLIFDYTDSTYVLFNMGNPTGIGFIIEEDGVRWYSDKIYNLQGKELHYIPVGTMYIRNQRLYISK
tara:strand:+ start:480 stop:992 length:513 start_codon:yes stop_codon:yes gene_type:complete